MRPILVPRPSSSLSFPALLGVLAAAAAAQPKPAAVGLPRGDTQLSRTGANLPLGGARWRVAAPRESVPPGPAGTVHTRRVAYAAYVDTDPSNATVLAFRRSIDGGQTWQPPRILYRFKSGEGWDANSFELLAWRHQVAVVLPFGTFSRTAKTGHLVHAFASGDQGQTWDGPVLLMTNAKRATKPTFDCDEMEAVVSAGIFHVAWEADYQDTQSREDLFYSSFLVDAAGKIRILTKDTRVNTGVAADRFDVDSVELAADGSVVSVVWRDDRAGFNDVYGKVSLVGGGDLATVKSVNHTAFSSSTRLRQARTAVAGRNVYVVWDSLTTGQDDHVWLRYSNDAGKTWTKVPISAKGDADGPLVAAEGNRVAIAWYDDRNNTVPSTGGVSRVNYGNDVFVRIDDLAGRGFGQAGKAPERLLSTLKPKNSTNPPYAASSTLWGLDLLGDTVALVWEENWWNTVRPPNAGGFWGEDVVVAISNDGGKTFLARFATGVGSAFHPPKTPGGPPPGGDPGPGTRDVDDPHLAIGAGGNVHVVWASDHVMGTGQNVLLTSGVRLPWLDDRTKAGNGMVVDLVAPAHRGPAPGHPVAVLLSLKGRSPALALDPANGLYMDLAVDALTLATANTPSVFLARIDSAGRAAFPNIPDIPKLYGVRPYATAISLELPSLRWTFVTDTLRF